MTILSSTKYISRYPVLMLSGEVVDLLSRAPTHISGGMDVLVKVFECFCHVINFRVTRESMSSLLFNQAVVLAFFGALSGTDLVSMSDTNRNRLARKFLDFLDFALTEGIDVTTYDWSGKLLKDNREKWIEAKKDIDPRREIYWSGWSVRSRKGKVVYLDVSRLWHSHGHEFVTNFHERIEMYALKNASANIPLLNCFANFIAGAARLWPVETFANPYRLPVLFESFMIDFFQKVSNKSSDIKCATIRWRNFVCAVEDVFITPGIWATPYVGALPRPKAGVASGSRKNIKQDADGNLYVDNLLTDVPLHISDEEAFKLLFKTIEQDIFDCETWAWRQVWQLRRAQLQRISLAKVGVVLSERARNGKSPSIEELGIENICATFEAEGFCAGDRTSDNRYGNNLKTIARLIGLPTVRSLFPFQCLLVIADPKITESFLGDLDLYNSQGQQSGFVKLDGGYYLIGYKDRKGKSLSQQKIKLDARSAVLVRQVIEITEPLRIFLKKSGNPAWRKLFLTSGHGFTVPKKASTQPWTADHVREGRTPASDLVREFSECIVAPLERIKKLISKLSLKRLRDSCGVQVYLRTRSAEAMANALGHTKYRPDLLSSYLPTEILDFFNERWIRVFQRTVVCWALDSEAKVFHQKIGFSSVEEFDVFMLRNALGELPSSLTDPSGARNRVLSPDKLHIAVNVEILTDLISLKMGVDQLPNVSEAHGLALYWSKFSDLLTMHIDSGYDPELKRYLRSARELARPWTKELIANVAS
ncbi:Uncharacterised protein [Pseudomonas putida]|nr:Uncharacterised protein [Pseudomonas putida]